MTTILQNMFPIIGDLTEKQKKGKLVATPRLHDYADLPDDIIKKRSQSVETLIMITNENSFPHDTIQTRFSPVDVLISLGIGPAAEWWIRLSDRLGGKSRTTEKHFHEATEACNIMLLRAAMKLGANAIIGTTTHWQLVDIQGPLLVSKSGTPVIFEDIHSFKNKRGKNSTQ